MADQRRLAREMALRVLYQTDVGGQSELEALNGALAQIGASVRAGITMVVREAEAHLAQPQPGPAVFVSRTEARERVRVKRAVLRNLGRCAAATEQPLAEVFVEPQQSDVGKVRWALDDSARVTGTRLRRSLDGSFLPPTEVAVAATVYTEGLDRMRRNLERRIAGACATARLMTDLVQGALRHRDEVDDRVAALATHWPRERQSAVDRNLLRLAGYELLHVSETPAAVVINEAIEIAKRYSTDASGTFVNGVLGALAESEGLTQRE